MKITHIESFQGRAKMSPPLTQVTVEIDRTRDGYGELTPEAKDKMLDLVDKALHAVLPEHRSLID